MSVSGAENKNSSLASSSLMGMVSSLKVKILEKIWRENQGKIWKLEHRDRGEDQHQRGGHGQLGLQVPGWVLSLEESYRIDNGEICRFYDYHSPISQSLIGLRIRYTHSRRQISLSSMFGT